MTTREINTVAANERSYELENKYVGQACFWRGLPAVIDGAIGGKAAIVVEGREVYLYEWTTVSAVMALGYGKFK